MATGFNTQVSNGEYRLQFETDNKEYYLLMQETARRCVDGKPVTNADRIRAMRDEELADYLRMLCRGIEDCADCNLHHEDCPGSSEFSAWITWIQQPAEGGQK